MSVTFTTEYATYLDEELFDAGEHTIDKPTKDQIRLLTAAHEAGVLVVEGLPEVGEKSDDVLAAEAADVAAAQGEWVDGGYDEAGRALPSRWSGAWHDGNVAQHALTQADKAEAKAAETDDDDDKADAKAKRAEAEALVANLGGDAS